MSLSSYFSALMWVVECALLLPPPQFVANHPFVFVIKNNELGIVLFAGRLSRV
jgi:serine protease inhibitor